MKRERIGLVLASALALVLALASCSGNSGTDGPQEDVPGQEVTDTTASDEPTISNEPTASDEPVEWTGELTDTYSNSATGYSFMAPDGFMMQTKEDEDGFTGRMYLQSEDPYMIIYSYVQEAGGHSIDELADNIAENFSATVVSLGENDVVLLSTDPDDGDVNYTKAILSNDRFYYVDIYYKPADNAQLAPVAQAIMDSLTV